MRKVLWFAMLITASFLVSCATDSNSNSANKPSVNSANNAAPAANPAAIDTELKKLVTDTAAALAKNDADALDRMYSDNYMLVNPDGAVQNKADRLASFRAGDTKFDSFAYDEVTVRSNAEGTAAVVIARATASGMNRGKKVPSPIRVTQVWSKTKDGWRQMSGQATPILGAYTAPASNTAAANRPSASLPAVNSGRPAGNTNTNTNTNANR